MVPPAILILIALTVIAILIVRYKMHQTGFRRGALPIVVGWSAIFVFIAFIAIIV